MTTSPVAPATIHPAGPDRVGRIGSGLAVLTFALAWAAWLVWGAPRIECGLDFVEFHGFVKGYLRDAVRAGEWPWWNPYAGLGRPFFADPEVASLYPPTWCFVALPMAPALAAYLALHFGLAGAGCIAWVRRAGGPAWWGVVLTMAFVVSAPLTGRLHTGLIQYVAALCYWPALLVTVEGWIERPRARGWVGLTLLLALQLLAGHPHVFWLTTWGLVFYLVGRASVGGWRPVLLTIATRLVGLGASYVAALALAAVQVLPFLTMVEEGNRVSGRGFAAAWALPWDALWTLVAFPAPEPAVSWENNLHVGLFIVLAAGVAWRARGWEPRLRGLLLSGALCAGIALGEKTPLFDLAAQVLPGFESFRLPSRFASWTAWALVAAAGLAWAPRVGDAEKLRRWRVFVAGVWAAGWSALAVWRVGAQGLPLAAFGVACGGALALALATRRAGSVGWRIGAAAAFPAVLLFELLGGPRNGAVGVNPSVEAVAELTAREASLIQRLKASDWNNGAAPARVFLPMRVVRANSGMARGYSTVLSYGALTPERVWREVHESAGVQPPRLMNTFPAAQIFEGGPMPYVGMNVAMGWDQGASAGVTSKQPGPRAWIVHAARVVPPGTTLREMGATAERLARTVLVEDAAWAAGLPAGGGAQKTDTSTPGPESAATIRGFTRNSVTIEARAPADGVLVLAEAWFPGWSATVDGEPADVFPVDGWMRGVRVPAGTREVVLRYFPPGFGQGLAITLGTGLLLGLLLVWPHKLEARCARLELAVRARVERGRTAGPATPAVTS